MSSQYFHAIWTDRHPFSHSLWLVRVAGSGHSKIFFGQFCFFCWRWCTVATQWCLNHWIKPLEKAVLVFLPGESKVGHLLLGRWGWAQSFDISKAPPLLSSNLLFEADVEGQLQAEGFLLQWWSNREDEEQRHCHLEHVGRTTFRGDGREILGANCEMNANKSSPFLIWVMHINRSWCPKKPRVARYLPICRTFTQLQRRSQYA